MNSHAERILVWDLPVRLFHALFAIGFAIAYSIAKFLGEESPSFPYHSMIGLTLGLMVAFRVVWLVVGPRWSRLSGLTLNPVRLFTYLKSLPNEKGETYVGHNPATSAAMLVMLALVLGLAWTGYQKALGNEGMEDVHSNLATAMLTMVALHIAGVIFASVRKRDGIVRGMIDGHKVGPTASAIQGPAVLAGVAFAAIVGSFFGGLARSYNPNTQTAILPLLGSRLSLGEGAEGTKPGSSRQSQSEMEEDDG